MKTLPDDVYRFEFDATANGPGAWLFSAEALFAAAKIIKKDAAEQRGEGLLASGLMLVPYPVYAMLLGYAIECTLKGIWVKNGHVLAKAGRFVGVPKVGDHQLAQLAIAIGVKLSAKEKDVLQRLSEFVLFAGRYPIPKKWEKSRPVRVSGQKSSDGRMNVANERPLRGARARAATMIKSPGYSPRVM
jgi:hypothetical protein